MTSAVSPISERNWPIRSKNRLAPGYQSREKALCIERDVVLEMGGLGFLGPELPEEDRQLAGTDAGTAADVEHPADRGCPSAGAARCRPPRRGLAGDVDEPLTFPLGTVDHGRPVGFVEAGVGRAVGVGVGVVGVRHGARPYGRRSPLAWALADEARTGRLGERVGNWCRTRTGLATGPG